MMSIGGEADERNNQPEASSVKKSGGRKLQFFSRQLQIFDSKLGIEMSRTFTLNSHGACVEEIEMA